MAGLLLVLLLLAAGGYVVLRDVGANSGAETADPQDVRPARAADVLGDLQQALRAGDAEAAASLAPPGDEAVAGRLGAVAGNAQALGLVDLTLRYHRDISTGAEAGRWPAVVDMSWRVPGVDRMPATAQVRAEFVADGNRVAISMLGGNGRTPVWLAGPVDVRWVDRDVVVMVADSLGAARAQQYAELVGRSLPAVRSAVPGWHGNIAVAVPAVSTGVDLALDASPGTHTDSAAVTGTADGAREPGSPVRILVNPDQLSGSAAIRDQGVITHELAHAAMGAATTTDALPLWLMEGFADVVAVRALRPSPLDSTDTLAEQVRGDGVPTALPGPEQFDLSAPAQRRAAYESARIACEILVDAAGLPGLRRVYREVEAGVTLDAALRQHAGVSEAELVRQWRARLARLAQR